MAKSNTTSNTTAKAEKDAAQAVEAAKIAAVEAQLVAKYGDRIVKGSVRRATDAKYGSKMMVTINTIGIDGQPDGKQREIATSDVFQVKHQPEVVVELRKLRAKEKRAQAKAQREASQPKAETETKGKTKAEKLEALGL